MKAHTDLERARRPPGWHWIRCLTIPLIVTLAAWASAEGQSVSLSQRLHYVGARSSLSQKLTESPQVCVEIQSHLVQSSLYVHRAPLRSTKNPAWSPRPPCTRTGLEIAYSPVPLKMAQPGSPLSDSAAPKEDTHAATDLGRLITRYARSYRVPESLVWAVIHVESHFNPNAVSAKGACGLMQLMPGTAADMGVTDSFDPEQNIAGGVRYLAQMLQEFKRTSLALAAYNAGPQPVRDYGAIPPYRETQAFVRRVRHYAHYYRTARRASLYKNRAAHIFQRFAHNENLLID